MPSSDVHATRRAFVFALTLAAAACCGGSARAQTTARGFAVDRLYASAPGGGWFVMDALDMHGGLGGALSFSLGYAGNPLVVRDGGQRLAVVSDEASADFGFAITYQRWRFYINLDLPLATMGQSGASDGYVITAPSVTLGSHPDSVADARLGVDVRLYGAPGGRFRLGASAQLFVPNGYRADYDSDDTFRGMVRALAAGDSGRFVYAAQLGVHIRPLDDVALPGYPRGSELLFGVAGGVKLPLGRRPLVVIIGPEVFGASAFRAFFGAQTTALEALAGARLEGTGDRGLQWRAKLGIGGGLDARFGAPEWRIVAGIEIFDHRAAH